MPAPADTARSIRALVLAVVAFGLVGTSTDLVFLEHYEEPTMLIPLGMNALAVVAIAFYAVNQTALRVRVLRIAMALLVVTSFVGIVLHYRGSLEFQIDMDPTLSASALFWKVMHMKAPPTLAPGVLAALGLFGLVATYRHPVLLTSRSTEE
jgi:hypothetical protein